MNIEIFPATNLDFNEIKILLSDNNLPVSDIKKDCISFFKAVENNNIIGIIGLEKYKNTGLLRSLAVKDGYKNLKIGERLVRYLFTFCQGKNIDELYLLTTTAEKYFKKFKFEKIERPKVPEEIMQTDEFKNICPESASVMRKRPV